MDQVITKVDDRTEERRVTLRLREGGLKEILTGLGPGGFCSSGPGRIVRHDEGLFFEFCFNVGTYRTRILAMSVAIDIPLTEDELKFVPPEEKEEDETPRVVGDVPGVVNMSGQFETEPDPSV